MTRDWEAHEVAIHHRKLTLNTSVSAKLQCQSGASLFNDAGAPDKAQLGEHNAHNLLRSRPS